jgi:hypothetical protein
MAIVTNTYQTSGAAGKQNRENIIRNTLENIDPSETPVYSMLDRDANVESIKPEWVQSTLSVPNPDNAQLEGDQYSYNAVNQPTRLANFTQIFMRTFIVSETQEAVTKVGDRSEVGRGRAEKGMELLTDMEASILSNNASVGGTTRKSAGMRAWTSTNAIMGAGGASGGFNTGTGVVDAATNGTQRAFTKALMDAALIAAYGNGGKPTIAVMSPYAKSQFSTFMNDANVAATRVNIQGDRPATIIGAADAYLSDWGLVDVVPDRQMARVGAALARNVFFITPDKLAKGFLRDIMEDKVAAKTGDALPYVLKCEFALINRNPKAHAVVADIFGMTAST